MKKTLLTILAAAAMLAGCSQNAPTPEKEDTRSWQRALFEDGNYAMFIHFGLFSNYEGVWDGTTYRGCAEWIMRQANVSPEEFMSRANTFNPSEFDGRAIAQLAKDAGMKYIVITSKHHEGFAMFDSEASDFNIVDATPCGRDLIGELADACHELGIGIGIYYSQFGDWTTPGSTSGPKTDADGRPVSFEEYFRTKCVPQVEEITTKYGDLEMVWFDAPGKIGPEYSKELVDLVHKNQPGCLVSSRVGNGMGDFKSGGDMEIPTSNRPGLWEAIDVTQVGWGYSRNDPEWKSPEYILKNLLSIIARGGTYMLNVGPDHLGRIHEEAAKPLLKVGEWIRKYPQAVYGAGPSPWGHALQWGDAVSQEGKLYLLVYDWPTSGVLEVPGLKTRIAKARIYGGRKLKVKQDGSGAVLSVPGVAPEEMVSVIELTLSGEPEADSTYTVIKGYPTVISATWASSKGCDNGGIYSEPVRFGEWVSRVGLSKIENGAEATWTVDIPDAGYYDVDIDIRGEGLLELAITTDEGYSITNRQMAYNVFTWTRCGWIHFDKPGRHTLTLSFPDPAPSLALTDLRITPVIK